MRKLLSVLLLSVLIALLLVPGALADRVVDYDDYETYSLSDGFSRVYTLNGETVRIVRREFIYYYEVDLDAEVYSVYWLGNVDCGGALYIDRLSQSGAHVVQVGDEMESCLMYSSDYVTSVRIVTDECKRIADYAFQACEADYDYQDGLKHVVLPFNLESIGKCAFDGQDNLARIYIPGTVTSMGSNCIPQTTTIVCHRNSYAATWARQNGRKYEIIEDALSSGKGVFTLPKDLKQIESQAFDKVPVKYVILPNLDLYLDNMNDLDIIYIYDRPTNAAADYTRNSTVNLAFLSDMN